MYLAFAIFWPCSTIPQNTDPLTKHPQSIFGSLAYFFLPLTHFQLKTIRTYRQNKYTKYLSVSVTQSWVQANAKSNSTILKNLLATLLMILLSSKKPYTFPAFLASFLKMLFFNYFIPAGHPLIMLRKIILKPTKYLTSQIQSPHIAIFCMFIKGFKFVMSTYKNTLNSKDQHVSSF